MSRIVTDVVGLFSSSFLLFFSPLFFVENIQKSVLKVPTAISKERQGGVLHHAAMMEILSCLSRRQPVGLDVLRESQSYQTATPAGALISVERTPREGMNYLSTPCAPSDLLA